MTDNSGEESATTTREWRLILAGLFWAAIVAACLTGMSVVGFKPEGPDAWTYDWRTFMFSKQAAEPRKDIAIILVGDDSLADYDYVSPADRGLLAKLVRALDETKVKAIGLDFIFDRKSENAKTKELIDALKSVRTPVVFGAIDKRAAGFSGENLRYQEDFIKETGRKVGHVFFARDIEKVKISDTVVRYIGDPSTDPPFRKSLSAMLAETVGNRPDPVTPYIAWMLAPSGSDLFTTFHVPRHNPGAGLDKILPTNWRSALEGKIILVGGDFVDRDRHLTPLSIWDGARIPGVMIQAQILAQRLDGRSIHVVPPEVEFVLLIVAAFLGFLISQQYASKRLDWVLYVVGIVVLMGGGIVLFAKFATILPTTFLLFAWTAGVTGAHYTKDVLHRISVAVPSRRLMAMKLTSDRGGTSPKQTIKPGGTV